MHDRVVTEITFRAARLPDDLDLLIGLYLESARYHVDLASDRFQLPDVALLRSELAAAGAQLHVIIANDAAAPIGFVGGYVRPDEPGGIRRASGPVLQITDIIVIERARRRGAGERLLAAIEQWGAENGASQAVLSVDSANAPAIALYGKVGFRPTTIEFAKHL